MRHEMGSGKINLSQGYRLSVVNDVERVKEKCHTPRHGNHIVKADKMIIKIKR